MNFLVGQVSDIMIGTSWLAVEAVTLPWNSSWPIHMRSEWDLFGVIVLEVLL